MEFKMKVVHALLFSIALGGCTSSPYVVEGVDVKDPKTHAIVSTDSTHENALFGGLDERVYITHLDDRELRSISWSSNHPEKVHLKEGQHELRLKFYYSGTYADACLWIDSKAGEKYVVRHETKSSTVKFWIENETTGEFSGGPCGSQNRGV